VSDEDGAAEQRDSRLLSGRPSVDPSSSVREGTLRAWTSLGPRCSVFESSFGDYSSAAGDVVYAGVGKCSSIASYVRLNPGNHPTAIVSRDEAPYPIVVGVPARPPRPRFSAEVAARLEAIARWDRSRQELEERLDDPNDRDGFLERYGG
jgi:hypothetical protein